MTWAIHHVYLPATDVRASAAFYSNILGMTEAAWTFPPPSQTGHLSADPARLCLFPGPSAAQGANAGLHLIRPEPEFARLNNLDHNPSIGGHVAIQVKDLDVQRGEILVRDGKGRKDRVTTLARSLAPELRAQLEHARELWQRDVREDLHACPEPRRARGAESARHGRVTRAGRVQVASWKIRPRVQRLPEWITETPWRMGAADQPRAERTGRSRVVKTRPWPCGIITAVPRDWARGRCSTSRNSPSPSVRATAAPRVACSARS